MRVPKGSMCGIGFRVSRPARLAVSSPNQRATTPWEISWRMIEGTTTASSRTDCSLITPRSMAMARITAPIRAMVLL